MFDYSLATRTGHPLTVKEAKFIDEYVKTGNGKRSVVAAGYTTKAVYQKAHLLLKKPYIAEEVKARLEEIRDRNIADATEILQYLTKVMRGEVKDQFGLEAPLSERTKAAQELAKRKIDIPNKLDAQKDAVVKVTLDWGNDQSSQNTQNDEDEEIDEAESY